MVPLFPTRLNMPMMIGALHNWQKNWAIRLFTMNLSNVLTTGKMSMMRNQDFMRPRLKDGSFRKDFDLLSTHGQGFIEGNTWNYSLYVPHNPVEMIATRGGKGVFCETP